MSVLAERYACTSTMATANAKQKRHLPRMRPKMQMEQEKLAKKGKQCSGTMFQFDFLIAAREDARVSGAEPLAALLLDLPNDLVSVHTTGKQRQRRNQVVREGLSKSETTKQNGTTRRLAKRQPVKERKGTTSPQTEQIERQIQMVNEERKVAIKYGVFASLGRAHLPPVSPCRYTVTK